MTLGTLGPKRKSLGQLFDTQALGHGLSHLGELVDNAGPRARA